MGVFTGLLVRRSIISVSVTNKKTAIDAVFFVIFYVIIYAAALWVYVLLTKSITLGAPIRKDTPKRVSVLIGNSIGHEPVKLVCTKIYCNFGINLIQ